MSRHSWLVPLAPPRHFLALLVWHHSEMLIRARPLLAAPCGMAMAALLSLSCSGSSPSDNDAENSAIAPDDTEESSQTPPPGRTTGDVCEDGTGDMFDDAFAAEGTLDEPAGIDIVTAEADLGAEGEGDLGVTFEVAGDVREVEDPLFTVFQGPPAELTSWELRLAGTDGDWMVELLTYQPDQRAEAAAEITVLDAAVDIADDGQRISAEIPAGQLPPVATLLWSFGSSATLDGNVVFDECSNLGT